MREVPPLDVSTICTNRRFGDMRYKRIVVTQYGGPDVITTTEEEIPAPKGGEVRVKVLAAGVGLPDVLAREGVHPETPRLPYTPGWDLVGTVDQLGQGVTGFELRQVVAAMPIHGCYAQYLCLPWRKLVPVPAGLESAEAVGVVLNYDVAVGEAGGRRDVRIVLRCRGRGGPGTGRHPYRLQERGLREGGPSPYR